MRCALYIRVSSDEQKRNGFSLPEQRHALMQYAKEKGYTIVDLYADEGVSSSKNPQRRHEFQRMLSDVKKGKIDIIVFLKLDRWYRNVGDYYLTQAILDQYGVKWECVVEKYDTTTRTGKLGLNIKLTVAEDESANASERVKFVQAGKVRNREPITGNQPFGYKIETIDGVKRIVKDPETQAECEDMFETFFATGSGGATSKYINAKYGRSLAENAIPRRLKNPFYTGEYRGVPDYCPAYITKEQHARILAIFAKRTRSTKRKKVYLFAGLIKCPVCGRTMVSCTMNKKTLGYRCRHHYMNKCTFVHTITEERIESFLLENIGSMLEQYLISYKEQNKAKKKPDPRKLEDRLSRLNNIYMMGNISDSEYTKKANEITAQIAAIKCANSNDLPIPEESIKILSDKRFATLYADLPRESRKALWMSLIDSIEVEGLYPKQVFFIGQERL